MTNARVRHAFQIGGPTKELIGSVVTGNLPPEEILQRLDSYGVEWYSTEHGDLMIRYWQVGAEDFVPTEHVARIQEGRATPPEANRLEWLSRHLQELRTRYAGQWIAVSGDRVVAASNDLPDLIQQVRESGLEEPFITQIPAGPIIWTTAYAS